MMERWNGKVAIVTGASVGIGAAVAEKLVKNGLKVVGLARRSENIETLSLKLSQEKGKLIALKCDITVEEELLNAFKWISNNIGVVHILINNAGVYRDTNLIDGDSNEWKKVLMTNVFALSVATREAIKIMKNADIQGHIVNVNCLSGHRNLYYANMNLYGASKHAVTALTETFRQELIITKSDIKISSISPGMVASELLITNNIKMSKELSETLNASPMLSPSDVADGILYILSTPSNVQVHELIIKPVGELI